MSDPMNEKLAEYLESGKKRFAEIEGELKTQGNRLREVEELRERVAGLGWSKDDSKRPFSISAVVRGMAAGGLDAAGAWKGAEREREAGVAARERALSQGTDSAGGYIVPEEAMTEVIDLLRSKLVVAQAGATQLNGLSGAPVTMPKLATAATAQWQNGENTSITASDQVLGQLSMSPRLCSAMTKMSRRLVALSNPSVEAIVRNDLLSQMARLIDLAALRGTGSSGQPTGISQTAGIGTETSVGVPVVDDIYAALYKCELANAPMGRGALICHPRTWDSIRKQRAGGSTTTDGAYLIQPDPTQAARGSILGFPVLTTTQLPINLGAGTNESVAYFSTDWAELILANWGTMTIEATDSGGDAFQYHQVWIKATMETDIGIRHPASFVELSGITA